MGRSAKGTPSPSKGKKQQQEEEEKELEAVTGFVAIRKGNNVQGCIFPSWEEAKVYLSSNQDDVEYKGFDSVESALKYLKGEDVDESTTTTTEKRKSASSTEEVGGEEEEYEDRRGDSKPSVTSVPTPAAPAPATAYPGYPYYPPYGYPYYPPYAAASSSSFQPASASKTPKTEGTQVANKKARTTNGTATNVVTKAPPRHRPPLHPMYYNGWTSNVCYKILVEYYQAVGTTNILYRPTMEALCKVHSQSFKDDLLPWMKQQRKDYHTFDRDLKDRTATFELLSKLDFPFGTAEEIDSEAFMKPSYVPRRKPPFLGMLKERPTPTELTEGIASQRQGPIWDCMYLALSDYLKISGTLTIMEPNYVLMILQQFATDPAYLDMDMLSLWMNTQRQTHREINLLTTQREMTKATSKLSCLQTIQFDWDYEPRIVDTIEDTTSFNKREFEKLIFNDGDQFLVRTDQGAYYKTMKQPPSVAAAAAAAASAPTATAAGGGDNKSSGTTTPKSTHLPNTVEKVGTKQNTTSTAKK
jgi:hypothetical protein